MIHPHVLAQVPGIEPGQAPLAVQPLPGGEGRNEVLRIDTAAGRFVWRRRLPPVDRPGAAARTEVAAHRHAAAAGLAPPVLRAAADGSWILMEYVEAPAWAEEELCSPEGVAALGRRLAELHALPLPAEVPPADPEAMARGYLERLARRDPRAAGSLRPLAQRVIDLGQELAALDEACVLAHGDLMASNLLGPAPMLVDWEYAQGADPSWDWACLLSYYPRLEGLLDVLLGATGMDSRAARRRLAVQRARFDLLNSLWERAYPPMA